ncbi:MAG TPA: phosphate signaling complex protein PhoU [Pelovirga sp.]|nr:phosphate signaling complex protein PhoU [Pelovirga sp.]
MPIYLQRQIDELKKQILALSAVVEETFHEAIRSLEHTDVSLADTVIARDHTVNEMEVDLEEECLKILALHQPVAIDLRFIVAVLKINNDLERISDISANIAQRTLGLATFNPIPIPFALFDMAEKVESMLKKSLDSLVNLDIELARDVCQLDDEVDAMHKENYSLVKNRIRQYPEQLDPLIEYLSVSRHLERVADLTTNIAEDILYMIDGEIIRHTY